MSKTPAKHPDAAPKKRPKLKLALLALAPLLLAGAGYAGWTQYIARPAEAADGGGHKTDPLKVAAVPPEVAAETSATHSFALSVLLSPRCGGLDAPALKAASDKEAHADGLLVSLSWQAAARRVAATRAESCGRLLGEVAMAEEDALLAAKAPGGQKQPAGH